MSAPRTNLEQQRRRHWGPLVGIAVVAIFAVGIIMYWIGEEAANSNPPAPAGTEARTPDQPAPSTIPVPAIGPDAGPDNPGATTAPRAPQPTLIDPATPPNTPEELTPQE